MKNFKVTQRKTDASLAKKSHANFLRLSDFQNFVEMLF